MKISFSPPDISDDEIAEVVDTLKSGWITTGHKTKKFETEIAKYCGTEKAVCLNSATAGLELVLRVLGVGDGDEVITSAYTYTASASVIEHVGAKIVLCDCARDGYEMDYSLLPALITEKTKVIIPVDIGGVMCDYTKILEIVDKKKALFKASDNEYQKLYNRIIVLADAAHSFGAVRDGITSGDMADFSSFSFHAVKNLTTGEGGAVTWKKKDGLASEELYKKFMLWSLHGQSKDALAKTKIGAWEYDIVLCGQKCNMTDIMAGIGLAQLRRYPHILERRKQIIDAYNQILSGYSVETLAHSGKGFASSGHLYLTRIKGITPEERNAIINLMAERGIATNVHYKPLPMHTAYKNMGFDINDYPNAYEKFASEISLPLHTCLTDEEVAYVAENYVEIIKRFAK